MDLVCLGEILIDLFPAEYGRRLAEVSAFIPRPGGAPANVAVAARPMPDEYFNKEGNFVSEAFMRYMKPLTGELPEFVRLEKIMVKK